MAFIDLFKSISESSNNNFISLEQLSDKIICVNIIKK